MAARTVVRPGRKLIYFLAGVVALYALVALTAEWKPQLGLDLQGGTRITFQARTEDGSNPPAGSMREARSIIDQRVNGRGVAEAEVSVQGGRNIIVEIPGQDRTDIAEEIGRSAQLYFRLVADIPAAYQQPTEPAEEQTELPAPAEDSREVANVLAWQSNPDAAWLERYQSFQCPTDGSFTDMADDPAQPLITCDALGYKFLLTAAPLEGKQLKDADWGTPPNGVGYVVTLNFNGEGSRIFAEVTGAINQAYNTDGTQKAFAIVLDGEVLSTPTVSSGAIAGGRAEISGDFSRDDAEGLANSLRYGALPLQFEIGEVSNEGPTLAGDQLSAGLLAGGLGLALVMIFCLLYYRGLGLVVVASLVAAGAITYGTVLILSEAADFTLSLPGIAGLIVGIGVTADSFIVYFERIRDEMREGKSMRVAVESGWARARNTCLAGDAVQMLMAVVLYFFAIGVVKGFAFALIISTLIDVVVFFWFTKPMVSWLARFSFFNNGNRFSGLSPETVGIEAIGVPRKLAMAGSAAPRTTTGGGQ